MDKTLTWNQLGRHCKKDGLCNWEMSTRLCKEPFCDSHTGLKPKYCRKHCSNFAVNTEEEKHNLIEEICANQLNTVAVKTIRISSLSQLEPLFSGDFDMNLKVVVLVRDPRSIYHSRKKIAMNNRKEVSRNFMIVSKILQESDEIDMSHYLVRLASECNSAAADLDFYLQAPSSIKSKIFLVRYEDLALNFVHFAKEIYSFTGLSYTDQSVHDLEAKLFKDAPKYKSSYKTERKLEREEVLKPWVQDDIFQEDELKFIQDVCKSSMKKWNYIAVDDINHGKIYKTVSNLLG